MSIWKRVVNMVRSYSGAARSDRKDLEATLDESYRSQLQLLQEVRRGVADVAISRKRVEIQISKLRRREADLDGDARRAVDAGDDEGAKRALTAKIAIEDAMADLVEQHAAIQADEAQLSDSAAQIQRKIESFRIRKDTLNARYTAAEARTKLHSAASGIAGEMGDVGDAMRETERRTQELEARANAVDELVAEGIIGDVTNNDPVDSFDRRFDALSRDADVDRQLEALKKDASGATRGEDKI